MLYWIDPSDEKSAFPDPRLALRDPDGLLAMGGDLSPRRLLRAYREGIFPWYSEGQPVLWWSPDPRAVLYPDAIKISRSLRKTLRNRGYQVSFDLNFTAVVAGCAEPRPGQIAGTWITPDMARAYENLHALGHAHSVEVWHGQTLVGGLYGIAIGRVFFGESMFSRQRDASKVAMVALAQALQKGQFHVIDCQVHSPHLVTLGAENIPRDEFLAILNQYCDLAADDSIWCTERQLVQV